MRVPASKGLFYTLLSLLLIAGGTWVAIRYAQGGYRFTDQGLSPETGLLSASSFPSGAEVYLNDKLVTATDDTLYLKPDTYTVKIAKDGFSTWQKDIKIESALVTQANARLFPSAPSITPLTYTGVENLLPSPDGQKIVYYTASSSASKKNGLYVLDLTDNTLSLQRGPRQISEDSSQIDLTTASMIWSPDSSQLMLISDAREILLDTSKKSDLDTLPDISFQRQQILDEWESEMQVREAQFLAKFPPQIIQIATQSAANIYFSPDKQRLLFTATSALDIPEPLITPVPAANTQLQERQLQPDRIYVYDLVEDRNFKVAAAPSAQLYDKKYLLTLDLKPESILPTLAASTSAIRSLQANTPTETAQHFNTYHSPLFADTLQWYPDSRHLFFVDDNTIKVMEYDGTNVHTLYSGPFANNFVYPWPDGSRLLIATSFTPNTPLNLYAIELK